MLTFDAMKKTYSEMIGESLREAGLLLFVFGGALHERTTQVVAMFAASIAALALGMFIERKRP